MVPHADGDLPQHSSPKQRETNFFALVTCVLHENDLCGIYKVCTESLFPRLGLLDRCSTGVCIVVKGLRVDIEIVLVSV